MGTADGGGGSERRADAAVARLLAVIARLRGEDGCPWDRAQTLDSLKPFLVEECYELIDAMERGDHDAHRDELGDVLLQVLLQSQIRAEEGAFDFEAVAKHLTEKLTRRHPHVFGDAEAATPEAVAKRWDQIKRAERDTEAPRAPMLDAVPRYLPALHRAQRVQDQAARTGFDWRQAADVLEKVDEELMEVREAMKTGMPDRVEDELGDLLFATVNLCRHEGVHAEEALGRAIRKFNGRFHEMERRILASGRMLETCSPEQLDTVWNQVKADAVAAHDG